LQKHKQDVSEAYIFNSTPNQTDYEFLKKNMNLQFFVNSYLFFASMQALGEHIIKIELHIKNKTTAEIDVHLTDLEPKLTITYDDFLLKIDFGGTQGEIEYDFKTAVSEKHYYDLELAPHTIDQYLKFYYAVGDNTESLYLFLSPYD
jgi:hypothetical protein